MGFVFIRNYGSDVTGLIGVTGYKYKSIGLGIKRKWTIIGYLMTKLLMV